MSWLHASGSPATAAATSVCVSRSPRRAACRSVRDVRFVVMAGTLHRGVWDCLGPTLGSRITGARARSVGHVHLLHAQPRAAPVRDEAPGLDRRPRGGPAGLPRLGRRPPARARGGVRRLSRRRGAGGGGRPRVRRLLSIGAPAGYGWRQFMPTRIELCGALTVEVDGRRVEGDLPGRQGRLLFAYLALNRERAVRRDELVDAVWDDRPPGAPDAGLAALLTRVRRALGPEAVEGRSQVRLALPDVWLDVEAARAAAAAAGPERALGRRAARGARRSALGRAGDGRARRAAARPGRAARRRPRRA